jgi:hypothetical protein
MENTKLTPDQMRDLNEFLAGIYESLKPIQQTQAELAVSAHALLEAAKERDPGFLAAYVKYSSDAVSQQLNGMLTAQLALIDLAIRRLRI